MSGMRCTEDQDGWQVHESFVLVTSALKDTVGKNATLFAGKNATLREKDARDRNKREKADISSVRHLDDDFLHSRTDMCIPRFCLFIHFCFCTSDVLRRRL